jgi:phytoene synthase
MVASQALVPVASDVDACRAILAEGSKSFNAASKLLPRRIRDPAAVFYAFCRVADDAVDDSPDPTAAVVALRTRLDDVFAGRPRPDPVDRALAQVVADYRLPRTPFDALLEGFEWDASGHVYEELGDVLAYSARVASAVGVVMTLLMGVRDPRAIARACDMGGAMQLTNIARDVGEDAARGRLYLPRTWLLEEGLDPDAFLREPRFEPAVGRVVERLLGEAARLYRRGDAGVPFLPRDCRPSIRAARAIYSDLGRVIAQAGHDSISDRAYVSTARKIWLAVSSYLPRSSPEDPGAPPLPEFAFLIEGIEGTEDATSE